MMESKMPSAEEGKRQDSLDPAVRLWSVRERLTNSVRTKLCKLPPSSSSNCIYTVPDRLRKVNTEAFTPRLVSIGPLHRGQPQLQAMEEYKLRCLKTFFDKKVDILAIVDFIVRDEAAVRHHYQDKFENLSSEDFSEMVLLDSVFLVELLLKNYFRNLREEVDEVFDKRWMTSDLLHDMMLLENQIPLFVPRTICDDYLGPLEQKDDNLRPLERKTFGELIHQCLSKAEVSFMTPGVRPVDSRLTVQETPYYAGSLYSNSTVSAVSTGLTPSNERTAATNAPTLPMQVSPTRPTQQLPRHLVEYLRMAHVPEPSTVRDAPMRTIEYARSATELLEAGVEFNNDTENRVPEQATGRVAPKRKFEYARSATELLEAGVKFKNDTGNRLVEIKFNNGLLKIPHLKVNEGSETFFRNLIAFEQCERISPRYISDYIVFMDSLINTAKDVDVLIEAKIIENSLNDSEEVSKLFNNLFKETILDGKDFYFADISSQLNDYSRDCWHQWKAKWYNWKGILKRDYFSSPWTIISVIAAIVLLVLTVVQTACSILGL